MVAPVDGALSGLRVLQLAALGPVPHAVLALTLMGADVVRVERPGGASFLSDPTPFTGEVVEVDLKDPAGRQAVLDLAAQADVLLEGFRPGVMERLGLGPDDCLAVNPRLVYGRMTGWGQDGPRADTAGHDLNYLALAGALSAIGPADAPPPPPLNLIADLGGGSMLLLVGVLAALYERDRSGAGQVVDAAMVDGVALLMQHALAMGRMGLWSTNRGANLLDGGAPFYRCYACADGRYVAVGALEAPFYTALLAGLRLDPATIPSRDDPTQWPALHALFAGQFATRTRDEWSAVFASTDACVTPVLDVDEAAADPHMASRGVLRPAAAKPASTKPAPAAVPRFSRSAPGTLEPGAQGQPASVEDVARRWTQAAGR